MATFLAVSIIKEKFQELQTLRRMRLMERLFYCGFLMLQEDWIFFISWTSFSEDYAWKSKKNFCGNWYFSVFVYGCHAKLEYPCVVNPGGINMSPSIWEKTEDVYKFADLIEQALSKWKKSMPT